MLIRAIAQTCLFITLCMPIMVEPAQFLPEIDEGLPNHSPSHTPAPLHSTPLHSTYSLTHSLTHSTCDTLCTYTTRTLTIPVSSRRTQATMSGVQDSSSHELTKEITRSLACRG